MRNKIKLLIIVLSVILLSGCELFGEEKTKITFDYGCDGINDYVCNTTNDNKLNCMLVMPECKGYSFVGWYDAKTSGNEVNLDADFPESKTIYAIWVKEGTSKPNNNSNKTSNNTENKVQKYKITFNINNGSGNTPSSVEVKYDEMMPKINKTIPTRSGYTFMGWYDNKDYTLGESYYNELNDPIKYYDNKKNITLYAGWKKNKEESKPPVIVETKKYTISFDVNGGEGNVPSMSEVKKGQMVPKISKTIPTRSGYTFMGWYDNKDYTKGKVYYNELNEPAIYYDKNEDIRLYAGWSKNIVVLSYKINFDANGGSGGQTSSISVKENENLPRITTTPPSKSGYTFAGWYDSKTGGTMYYNSTGTAQIKYSRKSDITLYARWKANQYSITFNGNGGNGSIPSSVKATYGEEVPKISNDIPTKSGYTFVGWYDNSDYTKGKIYYSSKCESVTKYTKSSDAILYAGWSKLNQSEYIVIFNANGGSGGQSTSVIAKTGSPMPNISNTKPSKTGYSFTGWYDDKISGTKYYTEECKSARNYDKKNGTTLYAHYTPITYKISYNLNGGTKGSSSPNDAKYDNVVKIDNPTKTFTITIDKNGSGATISKTSVSGKQEFIGWTADNNLDTNNAKYGKSKDISNSWSNSSNKVIDTYFKNLMNKNGTINLTANWKSIDIKLPKVEKSGYTCGYSSSETGTITYNSEGTYKPSITSSSAKVYVICSKGVYTVAFDANGGSGGQTSQVSATYGSPMPKISSNVPTKNGYTFLGWYDEKSGGTEYYNEKQASVRNYNKTKSIVLYAHYKACGAGNYVKDNVCTTCAVGYYSTESANAKCTACPSGYTTSGTGSKDKKSCHIKCSANTRVNVADSKCSESCGTGYSLSEHTVNAGSTSPSCNPNKYTITADANGGTIPATSGWTVASGSKTATKKVTYGSTYGTLPNPKKGNYKFVGWYTSKTAGKKVETTTKVQTVTNYTMYARWAENTQKITFNANGGSGTMKEQFVPSNTETPINANTFTKSGYAFTGWNTKKDGTGTRYADVSSITLSKDITLYAEWKACGAGNYVKDNVCIPCAKGTYSTGSSNAKCTACPSGYSTSGTGSKAKTDCYITCSANTRVSTANEKCTAKCSTGYTINQHTVIAGKTSAACTTNKYTISFDANGGTGGQTTQVKVSYNESMPTISQTKPTRSGYLFQGWYDDKTNGTKYYTSDLKSDKKYDKTTNITLYAHWKPCGPGTYLNGSSCTTCAKNYYSASVANAKCLACPSGYTTSSTGSKSITACTITCNANTRVTTSNAKCTTNCGTGYSISKHTVTAGKTSAACTANKYTITADANGGTIPATSEWTVASGSKTATKKITYDSTYGTLPTPTRTNYKFVGWYTNKTAGKKVESTTVVKATSSYTMYARWEGTAYKITFNTNGGTGTMTSQSGNYNSKVQLNENKFTRSGYSFAGWNTKKDGTGTSYSNKATITITGNIILYAKWTGCKAGTYSKGSICVDCEKGYYSTGSTNAKCTACPSGKTTNTTGSKSSTSCISNIVMPPSTATDKGTCGSEIKVEDLSVGQYCKYESDTLKYYVYQKDKIQRTTYIWVADAYNQLKTAISPFDPDNNFGTFEFDGKTYIHQKLRPDGSNYQKKNTADYSEMMNNISDTFTNKGLIGFNASPPSNEQYYSYYDDKKYGYPGNAIVIYEGQLLRPIDENLENFYGANIGLTEYGYLAYYSSYDSNQKQNTVTKLKEQVKKALDEGVKYTFGFFPVLVSSGNYNSKLETQECYNIKNMRHAIGQIDKNNFVNVGFFPDIKDRKDNYGFDCKGLADALLALGVKSGFNLDGGGSTAYFYKTNKSKLIGPGRSYQKDNVFSNKGRRGGNILYFIEK